LFTPHNDFEEKDQFYRIEKFASPWFDAAQFLLIYRVKFIATLWLLWQPAQWHSYPRQLKKGTRKSDTTLILDGLEKSMQQSFNLLDSFASISGLRINYEKTDQRDFGLVPCVFKEGK